MPAQTPLTRPRSKENTRALLVDAAIEVFVAKGIEGATVDDLTSAAGFTRGAFYSNFESKHEVFWAAFTEVTARAVRSVTSDVDYPESIDQLNQPANDLFTTLDALRPLGLQWYVLHTEAVSAALHDSDAQALLGEQRATLTNAIAGSFDQLADSLPVTLRLPSPLIAETLLGAYLNRMVTELVAGESDIEDTTLVLQGILDTFVKTTVEA